SHGQDYDGKNIMHTARLILTAQEIPTEGKINVDRTKDRDFLLPIKHENVDLKKVIEEWEVKVNEMKSLYDNSSLPDEVELGDLEYNIRTMHISETIRINQLKGEIATKKPLN